MQHGSHKIISATKYISAVGNIAEEYFNGLQDYAECKKKIFLTTRTLIQKFFKLFIQKVTEFV
jgi:hypothetical protein